MNFRRSKIIVELYDGLKSQDVEKIHLFAFFFGKKHRLRGNCQNSVPKGFIVTPIDVLCSNVVKFGCRKIDKIVRCLPDRKQNFDFATARIAPKICQDQPKTMYSECSRFHSNRFTFRRVMPERVNTITAGPRVFSIFG